MRQLVARKSREGNGAGILLVDDDPDICQGLQDLLEHEGYEVHIAGTGAEAVSVAQYPWHAVILDLGLPDIRGEEVLRQLLQMNPVIPVIVLTAFTGEQQETMSMAKGAYAYLSKPYDRDVLRAMLHRASSLNPRAVPAEQRSLP